MIKLHQRPLLNPGHVRSRYAQFLRDLPLRPLLAAVFETEPAADDLLLAFVQNVEMSVNFRLFDFHLHFLGDLVAVGAKYIDKGNFVSFLIRADRVVKGDVLLRLFQRAQMHENLVLDAASRERRQLRPFVGRIRLDCLNKPDRPDGNEILEIFPRIVELFEVVYAIRLQP